MAKIILVTGGSRSGKSIFAESICEYKKDKTAYIATSIPFDEEMKDRVKKHRENRNQNWKTYESYSDVHLLIPEISCDFNTVLLDCVTLMVTNLMFDYEAKLKDNKYKSTNSDDNLQKTPANAMDYDTELNYGDGIEGYNSNQIDILKSYVDSQIESLLSAIEETDLYCVFVTNELGMGIMPDNKLSRVYIDIAGKVNQRIAERSDEVYLTVSGIPVKIKG
ncbi:MAG: bifunctional adenosylcobinamide kinase/adenosylcobinamide-phosphate guanylyltransferase [Clostridioides sp.]|jgi:adenosylcobinamide kinase/adenosylcobinamide-phosphate guanylyltransferase|nr:bifunctional adenosylcobinamide kinase/adenosylcobinamide-phosphate guanylyltransferase [Clostridioides sp.]